LKYLETFKRQWLFSESMSMNRLFLLGALMASLMATGCASIVNDSSAPLRVETFNQAGKEVKDMECRFENDFGVQTVKTPGTVSVHRSSKDLQIVCAKPGEGDAKGVAISRANAGLAGNIIFGGGIGAIIDHNKGTAYTYPQWIRLVVDKLTTFDRSIDKDGAPNLGSGTVIARSQARPGTVQPRTGSPAATASARPVALEDLDALLPKK
jgi:hypothetical protein